MLSIQLRADRTRLGHQSILRLGPQTVVGGHSRKLRGAGYPDLWPTMDHIRSTAEEGKNRCGTHNTLETQCCCCGCPGRCCCGWMRARCPDCCSRSRRATHAVRLRQPRWRCQPLHYAFMHAAVQIARKGASRPMPLTRRTVNRESVIQSSVIQRPVIRLMGDAQHTRNPT